MRVLSRFAPSDETDVVAVPRPGVERAHDASFARIRLLAWALYGVLAAIYLGVLYSSIEGFARLAVLEVVYTIPIVASVVLSIVASYRAVGAERRFWVYLTVANSTLFLCEVLLVWWVLAVSPAGPPRVSWPFHILHTVAATSFLLLVVSMSRINQDGFAARIRHIIDIALLGVMAYAILLQVYVRPAMSVSNPPTSAVLIGGGYALTAFMLLFGTLVNIVGFKLTKWRSWELLTVISLAVYALAVATWPIWYTTVTDTSRNLTRGMLDIVQLTGHYVLMMAVIYRLTAPTQWHLRPLPAPAIVRRPGLASFLPVGAVVAIPLLGLSAFRSQGNSEWFAVFMVLASVLTGLILARSLVLTFEHGTLFHRSITDPLTGLYNHRFFHDRLSVEADAARRYGDPLCVIVLDIDDFGLFNERHGHTEGDLLLRALGDKLKLACPQPSFVARLGGDEFGIITPEVSVGEAAVICQHALDVIGIECGSQPGRLSASAGLAAFPEHASDPADLLRLADGALFHAKETGKDHLVVYDASRVPDLNARDRIDRLQMQSKVSAVRALAAAVDARDPATRFHSQKVAQLSVSLGRRLGLSGEHLRMLELAALMHDVGKIGLPDAILNKRDDLTEDEWREVRQHTVRGTHILGATELDVILPWVRGHHERWDGNGYPDGLSGDVIPFEARILCACDAFDAMTSDRAYRVALSTPVALREMELCAGAQFDPRIAAEFVALVMSEQEADAMSPISTDRSSGLRLSKWLSSDEFVPENT